MNMWEFFKRKKATKSKELHSDEAGEVFISYARVDKDKIIYIIKWLKEKGVSMWIDEGGIDGALSFPEIIAKAIEKCKIMIFFASKRSVESNWVKREIFYATEYKKPVLPIWLEPLEMPRDLKIVLSSIRYLEFFKGDTETNLLAILKSLQLHGVQTNAGSSSPCQPFSPGPAKGDEAKIIGFKSKDEKKYLLEELYGFKFDLTNPQHLHIVQNIAKQIKTENSKYGVAIDIDTLQISYNKAPLVCRDLEDLKIVLQNQLEVYTQARKWIIQLFSIKKDASFENDPLLRQLVADYESKIKIEFRTKGIHLNLKTNKIEECDLRFHAPDEVARYIKVCLDMLISRGQPSSPNYDTSHIEPAFFPTGGSNIL